jgi:hypothetical protein
MAHVSDYWTPMVVEQFIPNVMMTPLDSFLLTRIFESGQYEDRVYFFAEEWPGELIFLFDDEPDHLLEAIEKTKDIDPELCADVKRAMRTDGDTVEVNCYNFGSYCRVFQGIIRRSGGKLRYVTTQGAFTCSKMHPDDLGGMAEVITADIDRERLHLHLGAGQAGRTRIGEGKNDLDQRQPGVSAKVLTTAPIFSTLPSASRRGQAPHQPADPWQGGLPNRGCGR